MEMAKDATNPCLNMDKDGYLYVFRYRHSFQGRLQKQEPYKINAFEMIHILAYPQAHYNSEKGFFIAHKIQRRSSALWYIVAMVKIGIKLFILQVSDIIKTPFQSATESSPFLTITLAAWTKEPIYM